MEQSDLVDNTATFAMIMSFSFTQWTRIAVRVILPNAHQTHVASCRSSCSLFVLPDPSTPTKAYISGNVRLVQCKSLWMFTSQCLDSMVLHNKCSLMNCTFPCGQWIIWVKKREILIPICGSNFMKIGQELRPLVCKMTDIQTHK